MNQTNYAPNTVPTANIAVNKSRLKIYKNDGNLPTYYLNKGQEFQIELFNPTTDCILAKIILNGKTISQGGLVLNPGQRVYLDRYLDVPKKFLFDTYEVSNTSEVKKAIENNGDISIEFYKEKIALQYLYCNNFGTYGNPWNGYNDTGKFNYSPVSTTITLQNGAAGVTNNNSFYCSSNITSDTNDTTFTTSSASFSSNNTAVTDSLESSLSNQIKTNPIRRFSKSIETGRVEKGSESDQVLHEVNKDFEYFAFYTIQYKLLPISQKVNTVADINVKRYCTNCGAKTKKTNKFCYNCGTKA